MSECCAELSASSAPVLPGGWGAVVASAIAVTCVSALTEAFVSVLVGARGAALGAHSILQHVAVHAEQAVCPQRAFAGVAAPVALCIKTGSSRVKREGGERTQLMCSTCLFIDFSKSTCVDFFPPCFIMTEELHPIKSN